MVLWRNKIILNWNEEGFVVYLVTLEHWDRVDALPEVPQPKGRVLRRGHDQAGGRMGGGVGELLVVSGQLME